jgi:hypothetical protein
MNFPNLSNEDVKRKIKEAEQLIQEISHAQKKLRKTGSLLRRHLYHTTLYCKST